MATPITEETNVLTTNIDVASPKEIVKILEKCDSEIFHGWGDFASSKSLCSPSVLETISLVQRHVEGILRDSESNSGIVIAGCGTSGRLAFQAVRNMNNILLKTLKKTKPCFEYIIAGGDRALFTSQETFEDDPVMGAELLKNVASNKTRVLYIGITCGLSAPFIAGQIDYCLKNLNKFTPVLLGFNPIHLARVKRIEKWQNRSFRDLMESYQQMVLKGWAFLINPVVGPEAICGSSRMKGGTATKIILGTIFSGAYCQVYSTLSKPFKTETWIKSYEEVYYQVYRQAENISQVVEWASQALKSEGHIYYLSQDNLGITGLIDSSECPPTFGANMNDIKAFLAGGYNTLQNVEGDLTHYGEEYYISLQYFKDKISKHLQETDLVICLTTNSNINFVDSFLSSLKCKVVVANFYGQAKIFPCQQYTVLNIFIPFQTTESLIGSNMAQLWSVSFYEIAAKCFLNAVSTGAHILKGKVFQNLMIDMKPNNNKLFYRSLSIIQRFSGLSEIKSLEYLLQSIYNTDTLTPDILSAPIGIHVENSLNKSQIVPVALVAALKNCSIETAKEILVEEPVIRNVISTSVNLEFQEKK